MIVDLDKNFSISCRFVATRSGFKHVACILENGIVVSETKVCYLNRTWESDEFKTVMLKAIEKHIGKPNRKKFLTIINGGV